jgi:hypothetical protein
MTVLDPIYRGDSATITIAALTPVDVGGTVTKTTGSATLVGSGTVFTTDFPVGSLIIVPGISNERRTVIAVASDTSLTVDSAFAYSAIGQTAKKYGPLDLAGKVLWFTAKRRLTDIDAVAVFQKSSTGGGITVTNAPGGLASIDVLHEDTIGLSSRADTTLHWDVQVVAGVDVKTLDEGTWLIRVDVTQNVA